MEQVYIARRAHFSAAHRLYNPEFSEQQNWDTFGACNNPKGHGHNYTIEVWLRGPIDPQTGYVFDLTRLKQIVDAEIVQQVDHRHLNDVQGLEHATCECMCGWIWHWLQDRGQKATVIIVRETPSARCIYYGE